MNTERGAQTDYRTAFNQLVSKLGIPNSELNDPQTYTELHVPGETLSKVPLSLRRLLNVVYGRKSKITECYLTSHDGLIVLTESEQQDETSEGNPLLIEFSIDNMNAKVPSAELPSPLSTASMSQVLLMCPERSLKPTTVRSIARAICNMSNLGNVQVVIREIPYHLTNTAPA